MDDITGWLFMSNEQKAQSMREADDRRKSPKPGRNDYDYYV
jgi:hypothetical protein